MLIDFPPGFLIAVAVCLGLALGSFLNVVIHRLPRGENLAWPGSRCASCGKPIRFYDNLPVVSWLVLRGKARCCGSPFSVRYPLVELIGGLLAWAIFETHVSTLPPDTPWCHALGLFLLLLGAGLAVVAAAFIDLELMLVPDSLTFGGTALGVASVALRSDFGLLDSLLGAAVGFGVVWLIDRAYRVIRGQHGMGAGDGTLLMVAGAWFGYPGALFALAAGAMQGTVVAIALFAAKGRIEEPHAVVEERELAQKELESADPERRAALEAILAKDPFAEAPEPGLRLARIPFGPFIVLGFLEYMLFGPALLAWVLEP